MRRLFLRALAGLLCAIGSSSAATENVMPNELDYEPAEVLLTGRLTHRIFPGPPNYESVKRGDEAEPAFILQLDHPVNVRQSSSNPDLNSAAKNVRAMHVAVAGDDEEKERALWRQMKSLIGRDVVVRASLTHGITGHHRTDVMAFATAIRLKGAKAFPALVPRTDQERERDEARAADQKEAELKNAGIFTGAGPLPLETSFKPGKRVRLEGTLVRRKITAASPNLIWVKDGVQTLWILQLDDPISARPVNNHDPHEHTVENVRELALMIYLTDPLPRRNLRALGIDPVDDPDAAVYDPLFGRRFIVTGWLSSANSPYTPARMMVERIETARDAQR